VSSYFGRNSSFSGLIKCQEDYWRRNFVILATGKSRLGQRRRSFRHEHLADVLVSRLWPMNFLNIVLCLSYRRRVSTLEYPYRVTGTWGTATLISRRTDSSELSSSSELLSRSATQEFPKIFCFIIVLTRAFLWDLSWARSIPAYILPETAKEPAWGPTQPHIQWVWGRFFARGVKREGQGNWS
jgi:hypothetical protein